MQTGDFQLLSLLFTKLQFNKGVEKRFVRVLAHAEVDSGSAMPWNEIKNVEQYCPLIFIYSSNDWQLDTFLFPWSSELENYNNDDILPQLTKVIQMTKAL